MTRPRQFASDNYAGMCPEALDALVHANAGHVPGYGEDEWTIRAADALRDLFEADCQVFFVFNGTAANALALASMVQSYHSILCHETAHVETDECGAPEFFSNGTKVLLLEGDHGKVNPAGIERMVTKRSDIHFPKPGAVSITQATEVGTVYTPGEIAAVSAACRAHGLKLHMDGARFANAVASLDVPPKAVTWQAGVDVLTFGGTKNGLPIGEAVVFFDAAMARDFDYRCKQAGQLASKMRFLSAPWVAMLKTGAWLARARHANARAAQLEAGLRAIEGPRVLFPRQANGVFVDLPEGCPDRLRARGWRFYQFIAEGGCRFMCAWDTTEDDVRDLLADVRAVVAAAPAHADV